MTLLKRTHANTGSNIGHSPRFVFGMPVVFRDKATQPYYLQSIDALLKAIPESQWTAHKILVLLTEKDPIKSQIIHENISNHFGAAIASSILELQSLHEIETKEFEDSVARGSYDQWRAQVVEDCASLLELAWNRFDDHQYYLHLEDDIMINSRKFMDRLLKSVNKITKKTNGNWMAIKFEKRPFYRPGSTKHFGGFFGLVFPMRQLPKIATHLKTKCRDLPLDWSVGEYLINNNSRLHYINSQLFKHIGLVSSRPDINHAKKKRT